MFRVVRCLAGAVIVTVGDCYEKVKELVLKTAKKVVVGNGLDPATTMGPVISAQAKERILSDIETAINELQQASVALAQHVQAAAEAEATGGETSAPAEEASSDDEVIDAEFEAKETEEAKE